MNKFTLSLIFLNSLFVSIGTANAQSLINNPRNSNIEIERQTTNVDKIVQQLKLPSSKIAVIDQNHQVKTEDFLCVFKDLKEVGKQPFLQVKKETEKPNTKPESNAKSPKEDELEDFASIDLNKSSFIGKYSIQKDELAIGHQTTYKALDSSLLVRKVSFLENQGPIVWIEAEKNEKSLILDSSLKWRYVADSGYSVSGKRSILGFSDMDFSVSAIFAN
jgi:hypothetical protein